MTREYSLRLIKMEERHADGGMTDYTNVKILSERAILFDAKFICATLMHISVIRCPFGQNTEIKVTLTILLKCCIK